MRVFPTELTRIIAEGDGYTSSDVWLVARCAPSVERNGSSRCGQALLCYGRGNPDAETPGMEWIELAKTRGSPLPGCEVRDAARHPGTKVERYGLTTGKGWIVRIRFRLLAVGLLE